jgi:predicted acyl esterase
VRTLLALGFGVLALAAAPAAFASHPAGLFTKSDRVATMDDGVGIATTLFVPVEHAPHPGVFPAVVVFHGIGDHRGLFEPIAATFARRGYVVLTFDFRGHGESGGLFTGLGARELADVARLREQWLPANAPIRNDKVGGWGISLGGGALLRSIAEGEPYAAAEVVETWTDLYEAFAPQDHLKSGAIFRFLSSVPDARQDPELLAVRGAVSRRDTAWLRAFGEARSTRPLLRRGFPPTLFFQGRRDFVFGLEQGIGGYRAHGGVRKLYIGPFGHSPSRFPGPDLELMLDRGVEWFDRWLRDVPNGAERRPNVTLASEPFTGRVRGYATLPATRTRSYRLRGTATIGSAGKVVRRTRVPRLVETFGAPVVRVRASSTNGWSHLVAVLVARTRTGEEIVVSEGGTPTRLGRRPRTITIRLISQATRIPAGSRLELTLAGTSTAQDPGNLLYVVPVPERATITLGDVRLSVPTLKTPLSR